MHKLLKKKPFIIAEISANHNGSLSLAKKLILSAKKNGADAVKIQSYIPSSMTINSKKKDFLIKKGIWKNQKLWNLYEKAQTPFEWHQELFEYSRKRNINLFSTPFDTDAVDILEKLKCPFYKIASFEMTHLPLLKRIAKTKKTIIMSTGMANLNEIKFSYKYLKKNGAKDIIILYCVSNYPSKDKDFNLNNIKILKNTFGCKVGFSDHSNNIEIAKCALSAGAEIFEKHYALEGQTKGFDIKFSTKGRDLKIYKNQLKYYDLLHGKKFFFRTKKELNNKIFRRSIYSIREIPKGKKFSKNNIKIIRPGYGISPLNYYNLIKNGKSKFLIKKDTALKIKMIKMFKYKKLVK
jgi:pseudaminic acid synthase